MIRRISAKEARNNFSQLLGSVHYGRDIVIVEKQKKPMVAIIPADQLEQHMKMRRENFKILDQIRSDLPAVSEKEVQQDVSDALTSIRKKDD